MSDRYEAIDNKIIDAIRAIRLEHNACTAGQVANKTRIARERVIDRCRVMRGRGQVTWTAVSGSLEVVKDASTRLYELLIISSCERNAEAGVGDFAEIVEAARAEAYGSSSTPAPDTEESPTPAEQPARQQDSWPAYCVPCDRGFQNRGALTGHERSKAHAQMVARSAR